MTCSRTLNATRRLLTTKQELRPWKRKPLRGLPGSERNLATALDDYQPLASAQFEDLQNGACASLPPQPPYNLQPLYELRPLDSSSPLVVNDNSPRPARQKVNPQGVSGDVEELMPIFDACLAVGKLDRAALVIKRITSMGVFGTHDLTHFHNRYLRAKLVQIQQDPGLNKAEDLHQWYELEIRKQRLPQTAETIACMLKASLLTTHGSRLDRLIHRYMSMAPGEAGLEVLYMSDILTDQDLATITRICPTYNLLPEEVPSESTAENTQTKTEQAPEARVTEEVLATEQKGMGLRMLKGTLSLFSDLPEGFDISKLSYAERRDVQARLERECVDAAVARWSEENDSLLKMGLNTSLQRSTLSSKLWDWQNALEARLVHEFEEIEQAEAREKKSMEDLDRCVYGPILRQSTPSRLAAVTILSTLSSLAMHGADKGVPLATIVPQLAKIAEDDIRTQACGTEKKKRTGLKTPRRVLAYNSFKATSEQLSADQKDGTDPLTAHSETPKSSAAAYADMSWPVTVRTKVGAALLLALIDSAKITVVREHPVTKEPMSQLQPAFSHTSQVKRGKKRGMIMPNRTLVDLMKRVPQGAYIARHLPMIVEPEPWTKFDKGAFLETPATLVRMKDGEKDQRVYTEAAIARGDMDQVLKGLDVLGRTAWRINRPVFNVMLEAWNTGEAIADIPALNPDITIPPEPSSTDDPMKKSQWIRAVKAAENHKSGLHSVRCFINFQLEISRAFRDQTLYFPHNIDFRGRAYPIPTYLNHMGADHVRGLLIFAKGKELGEAGLKWLKVHLANVFGYDKASLTDRENFVLENYENIKDSVTDPLKGSRWWLEAEDPWQCLATCFELKAALDLPDPTKYVSHLPVHQDGTCNGLQHYAALGGDSWGARQVNLEPGDRPADVYSAVAALVQESIVADLKEGSPLAQALDGKITRKVVKQTVMTNVYGVTFSGAKKQVLKQLNDLYPDLGKQSGTENMLLASYVAAHIFKALSTMFQGAHDIQSWLGEIGSRVCRALTPEQVELIEKEKSEPKVKARRPVRKTLRNEVLDKFRSTLVWTTPLRMPVVQPYRKSSTRIIHTSLQDLVLTMPDSMDPVHKRKQLQAFPPNFIHSLDASHMLLSALECDEKGLVFAAVHDSFWTHAADVDVMNLVIRDAFIRIHSEDVIGRLAAEFKARYKNSLYLAKVNKTSEVGKRIVEFREKGRSNLRDELLLEKKRMELLSSSDPAEVKKGKKIVTPASIFEDMSAPQDILDQDEVDQEATLGVIPSEEKKAIEALEKKKLAKAKSILEAAAKEASELAESEDLLADDSEQGEESLFDRKLKKYSEEADFGLDFAARMATEKRVTKKLPATLEFWLPLTFPEIPAKGDFDVRRLKGSKYFFS